MATCKRCGMCCVGPGTMWTSSEHPLIEAINKDLPLEYYTDGGECAMLVKHENKTATCLIEQWLGHRAKPQACRDYPFDGDPCFREKQLQESEVRSEGT